MKKKLFGIGLVAAFAAMLFTGCAGDEDDEPEYESHSLHYVSEVEGVKANPMTLGYDENIFLDFDCNNYPFCEYKVEIRKNSASGDVVKTFTVKGDDVARKTTGSNGEIVKAGVAEKANGETSIKWSEVPDYSTFDSYVVLTAVKKPKVTVEFDKENSDFTDTHNYYFWHKSRESAAGELAESFTEIDDYSFDYFVVVVADKEYMNGKNLDAVSIPDGKREFDFNLKVLVDEKPVTDVICKDIVSGDPITGHVDWRKFTYDQLDPSSEHVVKVRVKK